MSSRQTRRMSTIVMALALLAAPLRGQQADYVIGPHDLLSVSVWEQPDLSGKFIVEIDGTFTFPLIGRVTAAGRTQQALESEIRRRLADGFLKDPQVSVAVEQYQSQMVHVVGEVRQAGSYPLSGEMRLIEILARAGSTTERAGGVVVITRGSGTIRVDLAALESGIDAQNIPVRGGDTIFVPRAPAFFVVGEVRAPGTYARGDSTTVLQALALAGGLTERGSDKRIRILRVVDGRKTELKVKLDELVRAGDTIVVGQRFF
jgi:polysaccharide biosynthesis/export protein